MLDIDRIDRILIHHIALDVINGTLLLSSDNFELQQLLEHMYDDMSAYEERGVICGRA